MEQIRTALIGYGSGGSVYNAPIIRSLPQYDVTHILTSSPGNVQAARRDFPEVVITEDLNSLLLAQDIDLFVILLPNHLHFPTAKKALEAGKNVLVEKPFTVTSEQADQLINLASQKQVVLSVNHNRRWDSDFRTVKSILSEGHLGRLVDYESRFDRFRSSVKEGWKEQTQIPGSGILYDLGSHLIDQALHLFGPPQEIFADIRTQRDSAEVPDNFELLLLYPDLRVRLCSGMLVKEKGYTYSLHGTKGSFVKKGVDVQEEALKAGLSPTDRPDWGKEPKGIWGKLNTTEEEMFFRSRRGDYRQVYIGLHQAITEGTPPAVTAEEARDVIKVVELAYLSHQERRALPFQ